MERITKEKELERREHICSQFEKGKERIGHWIRRECLLLNAVEELVDGK